MTFQALDVLRPFVKVSSRVAPRLVGNLAFDLFCTPPGLRGLDEAQRRQIAKAEARMDHGKRFRIAFEGGELAAFRFDAAGDTKRGTILLVHGWTGRAAFMSAFIEPLTASGFDVVAVDLPAHGSSTGRRLHVPLGVAALLAAHAETGPWHGIVAHSFGGAVVLATLAGAVAQFPAIAVDRLALIATPSSIPALFTWFAEAVGLSSGARRWFDANVLRLAGRPLDTFEGDRMLRQAGQPTLVLHARDDKEVGYANAEALASAGDHVTLVPLDGLGHRRILYAPQVLRHVQSFMAD